MNSFWNLVAFEYIKIIRKKSTIIALVLSLIVTVLSCYSILMGYHYVDGQPVESKMEVLNTDRTYARALAGRSIDNELLIETAQAYAKIPVRDRYTLTEEYKLYGRPYSEIYNMMTTVYNNKLHKFELRDVQNLTKEQADNFYNVRYKKLEDSVNSQPINNTSKGKLLSLDEQVSKPLIFDYTDGYTRFFAIMYTTGMIVCFVVAICISPIFAGEYLSGADQLILSSKHGKRKLIWAKLFTGITLSGILCTILTLITYFQCMLTYGFDGANAPFQLYIPMCSYPLTMGQIALIFSICILFANLLSTAITLLLSAKFMSPFGVIVMISMITIVPMFINIPDTNVVLHNLLSLIPSNMMGLWTITSPILYELFGVSLQPYIFMPIFASVATIILLPFAYHGFKNHQIG